MLLNCIPFNQSHINSHNKCKITVIFVSAGSAPDPWSRHLYYNIPLIEHNEVLTFFHLGFKKKRTFFGYYFSAFSVKGYTYTLMTLHSDIKVTSIVPIMFLHNSDTFRNEVCIDQLTHNCFRTPLEPFVNPCGLQNIPKNPSHDREPSDSLKNPKVPGSTHWFP